MSQVSSFEIIKIMLQTVSDVKTIWYVCNKTFFKMRIERQQQELFFVYKYHSYISDFLEFYKP